jgi:hypothetical protein
MNDRNLEIPLVHRFINLVRNGYNSLDADSRTEVREFVKSRMYPGGGFAGRDSRPDTYYSLFGAWLYTALNLSAVSGFHPLLNVNRDKSGRIDRLASLLIEALQYDNKFKKPSFFKLVGLTFWGNRQTSIYYRFFLFTLACDALFPGHFIKYLMRIVLMFFSPREGSPCSIYAATVVARETVALPTEREKEFLMAFFKEDKGFKAFADTDDADLLSTASALFALKYSDTDIRIITPACLNLLQENYSSGAFLAGNGDEIRDLEYTFYGLLALGTMV